MTAWCDLGKRPCDAALKYIAAMAKNKAASDGCNLPLPDMLQCSFHDPIVHACNETHKFESYQLQYFLEIFFA